MESVKVQTFLNSFLKRKSIKILILTYHESNSTDPMIHDKNVIKIRVDFVKDFFYNKARILTFKEMIPKKEMWWPVGIAHH